MTDWPGGGRGGDVEPASDPDAGANADDAGLTGTEGLECHAFRAHAPGSDAARAVGEASGATLGMVFEAPWSEQAPAYAVVVRPLIDNAEVVRRLVLYSADLPAAPEEAPSYTGATPEGAEIVYAWAPGGTGIDMREQGDVGLPLSMGTVMLGILYESDDPAATDASGLEVCVQRKAPATQVGVTVLGRDYAIEQYGWPQTGSNGPACQQSSAEWTGLCQPEADKPVHLLFVQPHMRDRGLRMTATLTDGAGGARVLWDGAFDASAQSTYVVDESLLPGETITTTCAFSEPTCSVYGGGRELCQLLVYASPRGHLADEGLFGSLLYGYACLGE